MHFLVQGGLLAHLSQQSHAAYAVKYHNQEEHLKFNIGHCRIALDIWVSEVARMFIAHHQKIHFAAALNFCRTHDSYARTERLSSDAALQVLQIDLFAQSPMLSQEQG